MDNLALFGWLLAAFTVAPELHQLRRGRRLEHHDGISPLTVTLTLVVFTLWLSYALRLSVWPAVFTDATALLLAALHARAAKVLSWNRIGAAVLVGFAGATLPAGVIGAAATSGSAIRGVPQLRQAWRSENLEGVSVGYWSIQAGSSAGWLVYGLAVGAPWLGAFALIATPVSAAIAVRVGAAQRRAVDADLCTV